MAKSKKPRRSYSLERNYARMAKLAVDPLAVVYAIHNNPLIIHAKTKRKVALTDVIYRAFHTVQYDWTVYTVVLLENSIGERYASIRECSPERRCYKEDIADTLNESHIEHIKSTKKADRVSTGWIGIPKRVELTEAEVIELMEVVPDVWTANERGSMLLDHEMTVEQQLAAELSKINKAP